MKEPLFFAFFGLILYTYALFPLLLFLRGLVFRRRNRNGEITPTVSLVIVAHNEAESIAAKIENLLALDYPAEKVQILVASDGSDDGTNEIVRRYVDRVGAQRLRLLAFPRRGKVPALNDAVAQARGEVLVFSDANSMFAEDALRKLLSPLADPDVGAVAGNQQYRGGSQNAASFGERLYWAFDRGLKHLQGKSGSVIGATGAIYAIRRTLFRRVPLGVCDDFVISARAIEQGYLLAFAADAVAYEPTAPSDRAEFRRRVRIIIRGLRALWVLRRLFNPLRHGFYSVQIFSHKLLRWSGGWMLLGLSATSLSLIQQGVWYDLVAAAQVVLYLTAATCWGISQLTSRKMPKAFAVPYYFCLVNVATVAAWLRLLRGESLDRWDSPRSTTTQETPARLRPTGDAVVVMSSTTEAGS